MTSIADKSDVNNGLPIVIIGGGIAGVSAIEVLAQQLVDKQLLLISVSPLIKVVSNLRRIGHTMSDFDVRQESNLYLQNKYKNIKVLTNKVMQIRGAEHELILKDGMIVKYHKLCICCGGRPKTIAIEEDNNDILPFILSIRDTETVHHFRDELKSAKRIVIVGNGGIATELVHEIQNCHIIWSVKDDSFGATFFDPIAAQFLLNEIKNDQKNSHSNETQISKRLKYTVSEDCNQYKDSLQFGTALGPDWTLGLEMRGNADKSVKIEYNCEVNNIYKNRDSIPQSMRHSIVECDSIAADNVWPIYVHLTNGRIYGCDFIVSATGVTPNTQFLLNGNNFEIGSDGGLLVNNEMMTNIEDIYAAGDVCSVGWNTSKLWFQMRLWTQARLMGVYAGYAIDCHLNNTSPQLYFNFDVFSHVTRFFGYKVILLGLFNGQNLDNNYEILLRVSPQKEFIKVILKDGRMCGAILIGETDLEETFENLISNQMDLSSFGDQLLNSNIDIDDYFD